MNCPRCSEKVPSYDILDHYRVMHPAEQQPNLDWVLGLKVHEAMGSALNKMRFDLSVKAYRMFLAEQQAAAEVWYLEQMMGD